MASMSDHCRVGFLHKKPHLKQSGYNQHIHEAIRVFA